MPSDNEVAFPVLATQERTALVARGRSRKVRAVGEGSMAVMVHAHVARG